MGLKSLEVPETGFHSNKEKRLARIPRNGKAGRRYKTQALRVQNTIASSRPFSFFANSIAQHSFLRQMFISKPCDSNVTVPNPRVKPRNRACSTATEWRKPQVEWIRFSLGLLLKLSNVDALTCYVLCFLVAARKKGCAWRMSC